MLKPRNIAVGVVISAVIVGAVLIVNGLADFDLSDHQLYEIEFVSNGAETVGTLVLPEKYSSGPVMLFVHGDGAQDRFSKNSYLPLINALIDSGVGVFTWDKPGVGDSKGNWLNQTMEDRATEALDAHQSVREFLNNSEQTIGFIGFSQAGWVLPIVAERIVQETPFVFVGGATNARAQGMYYQYNRMKKEGYSEEAIQTAVESDLKQSDAIFHPPVSYVEYLQTAGDNPMDSDRFEFVAKFYWIDSTKKLCDISAPTYAIFGEYDLNVDVEHEVSVYRKCLSGGHELNNVEIWPSATHGLAKERWLNYQQVSKTPWYAKAYAVVAGRHMFAHGAIESIVDWIMSVHKRISPQMLLR